MLIKPYPALGRLSLLHLGESDPARKVYMGNTYGKKIRRGRAYFRLNDGIGKDIREFNALLR